jgi:anti-sigma regulatory factor (Ser/Thr protein kinase)
LADERIFTQQSSPFEQRTERAAEVWDLVGVHGPDVSGLCRAGTTLLPGITGIGLAAGTTRSGLPIRFTSDDTSLEVEDLQNMLDEGPCRDAAGTRRPVLAADLTAGSWRHRWPRFAPAALDAGVRAVFALPLHAGGVRHDGAVDLYRRSPGGLFGTERTAALVFAAAAAELLTLEELNLDLNSAFTDGRNGNHRAQVGEMPSPAPPMPTPDWSAVLLARWFDTATLPAMRGLVRAAGALRGLSGTDLYDFVLAAYEAMTNVLRHGGGRGQLLLWWRADCLWCEITDHGPGIPGDNLPARLPSTTQLDQRGLWIIRRLCTSCKVTSDTTGTRLLMGYRTGH